MVKLQLDKYIAEKKIAHELIKKWWSVKADDGSYSNAYIISRTLENESVESAALTAVQDMQTDVINKLISNTFVVFSRLYYVSNAIPAEVVRQAAYALAEGITRDVERRCHEKS